MKRIRVLFLLVLILPLFLRFLSVEVATSNLEEAGKLGNSCEIGMNPAMGRYSKIGSLLSFMRMKRSIDQTSGIETLDAAILSTMVPVLIRFTEEKCLAEVTLFEEETGTEFRRVDGEVLHASSIYPAQVPWASINALAERSDVVRIESAVNVQEPTLDVSVPEIGADQVWNMLDITGSNKTGEGVIIADLDTGVDWDHEQFYYPDGTMKVERIYDATGEYVRPNLAGASPDVSGHGTSVAHALLGGQIGGAGDVGTYVGVAPGASLFAVKVFYPDAVDPVTGATWAQTRGADVIIYEFGRWSGGYFMDGSSAIEATIDTLAASGTVMVVPSGNLAGNWLGPDGMAGTADDSPQPGSERHARTTVPAGGSTYVRIDTRGIHFWYDDIEQEHLWITVLWRTPANNLAFSVNPPTLTGFVPLPSTAAPGWGTTPVDGMTVFSQRDNSPRGTAAFNIVIQNASGPPASIMMGVWTIRVTNPSDTSEEINLFNNDGLGWQGGAWWVDFRDDSTTITEPSTADSAISVASYATRARVTGTVGDYSFFTGMGPRIDGVQKPDIAAPGHFDVWAATSEDATGIPNDYDWFGGTSAAGPHIAGAAALMLQADPTLTHSDIKMTLRDTARQDAFTGLVPNSIWGWGKLDALAAVEAVQPVESVIYYDDGTAEWCYWWTDPGGIFAVRFTPAISGQLKRCQFCICAGYPIAPVKIHVMNADKIDVIAPFTYTVTTTGWIDVDLLAYGVGVSLGVDFYVGLEWTTANAPALGCDMSSPDGRSWDYNGVEWSQYADGDYLIRAVIAPARHDIAVTNVVPSKTVVAAGYPVSINVTVENQGNFTETFNVTAYYDTNHIETRTVTDLAPDTNTTLTFTWNTTGVTPGNYTLSAYAPRVLGETDTADNTFTDGTITILAYIHDIAIVNVKPSKTVVGQGYSFNINVTVENQGDVTETFNVTAYANTTIIKTKETTLTSGNSTTIVFICNTTGFVKGNYTISAYATPLPGETDTIDNTYRDGWVVVAMVGDITGPEGFPDGKVEMRDVSLVASKFGVNYPAPRYDANCDITGPTPGVADGKIEMRDVSLVASNFGKIDP